MKLLITGAAGFIGSALAGRLLERGDTVVGIDNLNEYYDVNLKKARLERLSTREKFTFEKLDIADCLGVKALFARERFDALGACRTCDATSSLCKTGQPNEVENNIQCREPRRKCVLVLRLRLFEMIFCGNPAGFAFSSLSRLVSPTGC